MRIAYGVMGYGRGHATRAAAVLPALAGEHEVTVFAGGDAHALLAPRFPTVEIPTLGYVYGVTSRPSLWKTMAANARGARDVLGHGPASRSIAEQFESRGIELVISDSEAWTHRVAARLGLPRISFDHVGIIAWCKPHFPPDLWVSGTRDGFIYRQLMGRPERILIASFYPAEPLDSRTRLVGPVLRPEVLSARPVDDGFLLAYFNRGDAQFTPRIEQALRRLDLPVKVYGTSRRGEQDNLLFRAIDGHAFLQDLVCCRAVVATAGSQLIGEALQLRKPFLALPERVFEQQLNARIVDRMGVGLWRDATRFSEEDVDVLLGNLERYRGNMAAYPGDGREAAVLHLRTFIEELRPAGRRS